MEETEKRSIPNMEKKTSRFGLASLILGALNLIAILVQLAGVASEITSDAALNNGPSQIVFFLIPAIGILLGIVGVLEGNKKRSCASAGLMLNLAPPLVLVYLFCC